PAARAILKRMVQASPSAAAGESEIGGGDTGVMASRTRAGRRGVGAAGCAGAALAAVAGPRSQSSSGATSASNPFAGGGTAARKAKKHRPRRPRHAGGRAAPPLRRRAVSDAAPRIMRLGERGCARLLPHPGVLALHLGGDDILADREPIAIAQQMRPIQAKG